MSMKCQFEKMVGQLLNSLIRLQVMVLESNLKTNALLWHSAISNRGEIITSFCLVTEDFDFSDRGCEFESHRDDLIFLKILL